MEPTDWLEQHVYGFRYLSRQERTAISDFALLWSLFESRALNNNASAQAILSLTCKWRDRGVLDPDSFNVVLEYFRNRYFPGGVPSDHFKNLNLRHNNKPLLVEAVLRRENEDPVDRVAVSLIVIYRFRNNLFHGMKWDYGIRDQLENFNMANNALMLALER